MRRVAALIVSWNCMDALKGCLNALKSKAPAGIDIIIVDNASSDSTPVMVRDAYPEATLLEQSRNLGFAKANNLALSKTDAEYLLVLNPDTEVFPGMVEALTECLDKTPQAGLCCPQIIDKHGVIVPSTFRFPSIWNYWTEHSLFLKPIEGLRRMLKRQSRPPSALSRAREIEWATGAALMVRRAALNGQPLFDERFFLYSEDADLCLRLEKAGWKRYLVPGALIRHSHRQSSGKSLSSSIVHLFRSMDVYFEKNKGQFGRFFLRLFICIDMILRLVIIKIYPGKETFRVENIQRKKAYREVIRTLNPFHLNRASGING